MRTVSRKSERLVNLTIALLATSRWITKSEIYQNIEGYTGEADAKERMFERDKEELRNLGIEIEVGTFDPLFEDEVGYRIRPENYKMQVSDLTPRQLALISSATQSWRGAILESKASTGLAKLKALGIESDVDGIPLNPHQLQNSDSNLIHVIDALALRKTISFSYRAKDNTFEERALDPYGVGTKNGFWYVAGHDLQRRDVRLFRLDRFVSEVKEQGRAGSYEIPESFAMHQQLASESRKQVAQLLIRKGKAHRLRKHSRILDSSEEWDRVEFSFTRISDAVSDLLWHRDDVIVQGPTQVQKAVLDAVDFARVRHE